MISVSFYFCKGRFFIVNLAKKRYRILFKPTKFKNVKKYVSKGSLVAVEGRIQTRTYDDQNGNKRYITEVVADNVEFLGSKNSSNTNTNSSAKGNAEPTPYDFGDAPEPKGTDVDSNPFADFGANIEISDDELPF